ncbi:MAG TPA: HAMP domain-containing sensor histidine kinase [Longimicrobiales bacterium]|nr:HAMP domain-containing sensor histidine kinase [Longimicrobiales bacterium]
MDSLLERYEPKQRHLAFLVGLLLLTFVLTVLLAFRAHRSEIARQLQVRAVLDDLSGQAVQQWERYLVEYGNEAVMQSFRMAGMHLSQQRDLSLESLAAGVKPLCADCASEEPHAYFDIRPSDEGFAVAALDHRVPAEVVDAVMSAVALGRYSAVGDSLALGLMVAGLENGEVSAATTMVRLGPDEDVVRVVGYHVPPALLQEFLLLAFDAYPAIPKPWARGAPNTEFFAIQADRDGRVMLAMAEGEQITATSRIQSGVLAGTTLHAGIRDNATRHLVAEGGLNSGVPLLLTLMFAICGLIVVALVLVRREAELVRLRADFISGVSHELRTPLAQIRMFTETLLLNRVRSDVERRRSLEIIDQEARRLTHLVENVLLFSKSEGGRRQPLAPEPTDLAAEVRRAAESFGPMWRTRDMSVRTELQDGITVAVDRGALRQIMVNLLDNALKYGPPGQRVTVGVALFDEAARVWVDDEGPGIPVADRDRIFEAFVRLARDTTSRSSGSGIGLSVVRELARLHGGNAWVTDAPGGGARIVVQFPGAYLRAEPPAEFAAAS